MYHEQLDVVKPVHHFRDSRPSHMRKLYDMKNISVLKHDLLKLSQKLNKQGGKVKINHG